MSIFRIVINRSYIIWMIVLAILSIILTQIPLFNILAFEFSIVISIAIALAAAHVAITIVKRIREADSNSIRGISYVSSGSVIISTYFWTLLANLLLLIPPLIIILINAFWVKTCDFMEGFAFYGLIPVITCVYSTAAGLFFAFWLSKRWQAYLVYLSYILSTIAFNLYHFIFHPPAFLYNSVIGFFSISVFTDEEIFITSTFILARITTLILTGIFLMLSINIICEPFSSLKLDFRKLFNFKLSLNKTIHRICLCLLSLVFILIFINRSNLGLQSSRSYIQKKLGGVYETVHFNIYYERDSKTERDIELIAKDHEFRYHQLTKFFNFNPQNKIKSYIYSTPQQKNELIGAKYTQIANKHEIHLNYSISFPHRVLKHELAHVFSLYPIPFFKELKLYFYPGLVEGIAVAAEWDEGRLDAHQWSKAMKKLAVAPSIKKMMSLSFLTEPLSRSYTISGSFVCFLVDTYGIDTFKNVLLTRNFQKIYGKKIAELSTEWENFLETKVTLSKNELITAEYIFNVPSIFKKPCAHKITELQDKAWDNYLNSDYRTSINLFQKIYKYNKNDPYPLMGLLYSYFFTKDYMQAMRIADQIINHRKSSNLLIAKAKEYKGNTLWMKGQPGKARDFFREVYKMHISNHFDRWLSVKLEAVSSPDPELQAKMKKYLFTSEKKPIEELLLLKEILQSQPGYSTAYYLIGRKLHYERKYAHSNEYLIKSDSLGLPDESLTIENYLLLGINYFHLGEYEKSIAYFEKIIGSNQPLGELNLAKDWIERCEWTKKGSM